MARREQRRTRGNGVAVVLALVGSASLAFAKEPTLAKDGARYRVWPNRALVRVYDGGLVVAFSGEGFRGYDLALRDVWGAPAPARPLLGQARLSLPWSGGAATITVRFVGRGQLTFGKRRFELRGQRQPVEQVLELGEHPAGELELGLSPKGKLAVESLRLAAPGAAACPAPARSPLATGELGDARALELSIELPDRAALAFTPVGGDGAVVVRGEGGQPRELWRGRGDGRRRVVPLNLPAQLAELSFRSDDCTLRWRDLELGVVGDVPVAEPAPRAKHVILIVVDTLRADRLELVAKTAVRTPRLTQAAQRGGLVAPRHLAIAPSSPPSHATIHTGQLPRVHGAVGDTAQLADGAPVLSAILRERGYFTGYVGNNDFAMGRLAKAARWSAAHTPVFEDQGIDCAPLVERGLTLMKRARDLGQRAFVTLLPIEPHVPYRFHDGITERYFAGPYGKPLGKRVTSAHLSRIKTRGLPADGWAQLRALYDGEVTYFDACFGALEQGLDELGVRDDTVLVLTSDHGEGLGERGNNTGHAYSLHHELVWVPLVIFGGPVADGTLARAPGATSNLDVAPTVLELLGERVDPAMAGQSLVPHLRQQARWPRAAAAEYGKAYAISAGRWHYVADYQGRGKLYDVMTDPAQLSDRSVDAPVALRHLRQAAAVFLSQRVRWRGAWGTWTDFADAHPWARAGAR